MEMHQEWFITVVLLFAFFLRSSTFLSRGLGLFFVCEYEGCLHELPRL